MAAAVTESIKDMVLSAAGTSGMQFACPHTEWQIILSRRGVEAMSKAGLFGCSLLLAAASSATPSSAIEFANVFSQSDCDACGASCTTADCTSLACDGSSSCREPSSCGRWFLFPQSECGINVHGWINGGFIGNTSDPGSRFNGPYNAVDRSNEGMMNQAYLVAEKGLPRCGRGIGGRVDILYGEDFFLAESIGIEKRTDGSPHWNPEYYGWAVPQAYVSLGREDMNVQVGHFYSIVGYEGVMAPDNFFYSKSYSYQFAGPFTHWGAQANWSPNSAWTFQAGVHNGWDAFDRTSDKVGFIGKARYDDHCTGLWTSFAVTSGDENNNSAGLPIATDYTNRTRYSWLIGVPLRGDTEYIIHHWMGWQEDGSLSGDGNWYGIDHYVYHTINDCWKAGMRYEWFRDEDGTRVGLNRVSNPNIPPLAGNYYSVALGLNWTPTYNLTVRPEVRFDWFNGTAPPEPYDDGSDDSQIMLGLDAVLLF